MGMKRHLTFAACAASLAFAVPVLQSDEAYAGPSTPADEILVQAAAAPDYSELRNWAAHPDVIGPASQLPAGASAAAVKPDVDVFYVHPTTFRSQTHWTQDTEDAEASRWTDESVIARQASVFSACCRIWSPRYRAAGTKSLFSDAHRDPAFAFAYADIERAFAWFLSQIGPDRPFIIAGHSQGAKHISDLLEKQIDGQALQKRMVAAYIIGINIAEGEFGLRFKHVPICDRPAQIGCALQWNAIEAGTDLNARTAAYEKSFIDTYGPDAKGRQTLCINPITFDRSKPDAISSKALGAVPGEPGYGPMRGLRASAVAVRCERGMAITYLAPGLDLKALPGGVLHYHDVGLFYADLRANAVLRANTWVKQNDH